MLNCEAFLLIDRPPSIHGILIVSMPKHQLQPANDERVLSTLLRLAGPVIAATISRTIMSFVDFAMVSELGTDAQAAVVAAGIMGFCLIAFGQGLMSVVNTFVSQALGKGKTEECSSYAWQGIYISAVLGIVLLPCWFITEELFAWIGHDSTVQQYEAIYFQIGLLTIAPAIASVAIANFFNGIHRPTIGLIAGLISNIFNVIANYALIFGHFGFPAMGIAGAAWGTLIASILQVAILWLWMIYGPGMSQFSSRRGWQPNMSRMAALIRVGLPAALHFSLDIVAWTIFTNILVGKFGTVHLAANNICFKLLELSFMPAMGLGTALTAAVGKSIGRKRYDLAKRYIHYAVAMNVGYMTTVGITLVIFRGPLVGLFNDDPEVIYWAGRILILCALFQIGDGLGITFISALRGAGDTVWPAMIGIFYALFVFLLGGWWLSENMPQYASLGPWAAGAAYIILLGITMWLRYMTGAWEKIELLGDVAVAD